MIFGVEQTHGRKVFAGIIVVFFDTQYPVTNPPAAVKAECGTRTGHPGNQILTLTIDKADKRKAIRRITNGAAPLVRKMSAEGAKSLFYLPEIKRVRKQEG